jgi:hypothetical protein
MPSSNQRNDGGKSTVNDLIPIGTKTKIGKVCGIHWSHDNIERYYFLIDKHGSIAYMPQSAMEGIL